MAFEGRSRRCRTIARSSRRPRSRAPRRTAVAPSTSITQPHVLRPLRMYRSVRRRRSSSCRSRRSRRSRLSVPTADDHDPGKEQPAAALARGSRRRPVPSSWTLSPAAAILLPPLETCVLPARIVRPRRPTAQWGAHPSAGGCGRYRPSGCCVSGSAVQRAAQLGAGAPRGRAARRRRARARSRPSIAQPMQITITTTRITGGAGTIAAAPSRPPHASAVKAANAHASRAWCSEGAERMLQVVPAQASACTGGGPSGSPAGPARAGRLPVPAKAATAARAAASRPVFSAFSCASA